MAKKYSIKIDQHDIQFLENTDNRRNAETRYNKIREFVMLYTVLRKRIVEEF